ELILSDESTYKHKGTVDFIDRGVDASTGSILVQSSFPNPDLLLRPGLFAKVKVKMKQEKDGIIVPQRCVMELQGQYSVYVVNDDNTVESRTVKPGHTAGDYWLITEGLKANEKVVLEGIQKVHSGMQIKPAITEFKSQVQQ
ncbi:MAG: efflux RND transporter periplasmic adaptor subunit, partial [Bacteroidales bacterium]|nr:efflux RND transporter periplasmic adaptor subunit [Bacteroidales bacterium]